MSANNCELLLGANQNPEGFGVNAHTALALSDGSNGVLRKVGEGDKEPLGQLYERLNDQQRLTRFFTPTDVSTARYLGLRDSSVYNPDCNHDVMVDNTGRALGHAGFTLFSTQSRWGEMHFVVDPGYQGNGLGWQLARRTVVAGQVLGLVGVTASVRPENEPMLKIMRRLPEVLDGSEGRLDESRIEVNGTDVVRFMLRLN